VIAQQEGFAKAGDTIAITGGMPFGVSGGTNLLRIAQLPSDRSVDGGEGRKSS
jgi:pyruvate kinase